MSAKRLFNSEQQGVHKHGSGDPPLDEEGFRQASDTCCNYQMDMYIRRVLDDMDFEICDAGCHNGFTPFFSCDPARTLGNLRYEIEKIIF